MNKAASYFAMCNCLRPYGGHADTCPLSPTYEPPEPSLQVVTGARNDWGGMTPTEGATAMTTLERIEAALAHLAPDQQARDDWATVEHTCRSLLRPGSFEWWQTFDALDRLKARRDAAYRELFAAKIELMGRGEGTSMS